MRPISWRHCRRLFALLPLALASCVQRAYDRTVVFQLDVSHVKGVRTVGLRGEGGPLSWQSDLPMQAVTPDSLYTATVTYHTGYIGTDVKFTVNGEFELQNQENRRVRVAPTTTGGDTTVYRAVFDRR